MLKERLINQQVLFDSLSDGASILTGNNRLARDLITRFDASNVAQNNKHWSSPDIIPINNWLIRNWEQALLCGIIPAKNILLSPVQEFTVWEAIIKNSPYGNGLLRISATAKSVRDSWVLLQQWNLSHDNSDYQMNDDLKAFHFWSIEFEKKCQQKNWITIAQLTSLDYFSNSTLPLNIILLGFDELTPQQQLFFEAINQSPDLNTTISWVRETNSFDNRHVSRLQCKDIRFEIEAFAFWAKQQLQNDPSATIALVAPNLSTIRQVLLQTLERVLIPSKTHPISNLDDLACPVWDISLGLALSNYSLIKLAFKLLGIVRGKISMEVISCILRSVDIDGALEELNQRALLDRHLREQGEQFISLQTVVFYASESTKSYYCPILSNKMSLLIDMKRSCYNRASSQQWASWMSTCLKSAGWGNARTLNREQFQILESWKGILQKFSSLQIVCNKMTLDEALVSLQTLASETIFQIQSNTAPIRILGIYESIGLKFDHLWVINLYDEVWPTTPRINPFIPVDIQKKYLMPRSSWQRELQLAKKTTTRLENSAQNVIFSYPEKNGLLALGISPLIAEYEATTIDSIILKQPLSWQQVIIEHSKLVELDADEVVELTTEPISGGSSIFKNQSLCPFKALIENRLHAKPMRKTQIGLDAMKRGSLIHSVLELFWNNIIDQQQLKSKSTIELDAIVNLCIKQGIAGLAKKSPNSFGSSFTQIEQQRLFLLMKNWIAVELQRAPFKVISTEQEFKVNINGVMTQLYIDRIDELEDGSQIVIDYKTGSVAATDWFGERPNDPQLPLYSIAINNNLSAVLFAQINISDLKFNGVVEQIDLIPKLPPSRKGVLKQATDQWPSVLQIWQDMIYGLATQFVKSDIAIDPKEGTATCNKLYCELSSVCRINELIEKNESENHSSDLSQ